jgi:hypothetical protein
MPLPPLPDRTGAGSPVALCEGLPVLGPRDGRLHSNGPTSAPNTPICSTSSLLPRLLNRTWT